MKIRELKITKLSPRIVGNLISNIRINDTTGCWIWTGYKQKRYGIVNFRTLDKSPILVHRLMYAWLVGDLPDDRVLDHFVCDNPSCCNPDHLMLVHQTDNMLRGPYGDNSRKTHCKRGHLLPSRDNNGLRRCKICITLKRKQRYHNKLKSMSPDELIAFRKKNHDSYLIRKGQVS